MALAVGFAGFADQKPHVRALLKTRKRQQKSTNMKWSAWSIEMKQKAIQEEDLKVLKLREELEAIGIRAISCDLRACEVGGMHYQGDIRDIIDARVWVHTDRKQVRDARHVLRPHRVEQPVRLLPVPLRQFHALFLQFCLLRLSRIKLLTCQQLKKKMASAFFSHLKSFFQSRKRSLK